MFRQHPAQHRGAVIVQGTFIAAAAILGRGDPELLGNRHPARDPQLGQHHAEGRTLFRVFPTTSSIPGILPGPHRAGHHIMGDGLRTRLDPKMSKKL